MRALITGAGGFAGLHLARWLARDLDWQVYGLIRRPVEHAPYLPVIADLLDRERVATVVADIAPTHVFHLAAQSHVPTSHADPGATLANNLIGQVNLLDACRALTEPPRVLVVGSAEEYGLARPEEMPLREEQPFRPTSPYAVSKVAQDLLGWQYFISYGLPVVRVRAFNHTGPGQSDRFVVSAFARQIAEIDAGCRSPVLWVGNLDAQRDFLDVRDVVRAYALALQHGEAGAVYNIGSGTAVAVRDLLDLLVGMSRSVVEVRPDPARLRPADVPLLVADSSRLRAVTGWRPEVTLEASVRETLAWWRAQVGTEPARQAEASQA